MSGTSLTARVAVIAGVCAVGAPVAVAWATADTQTTGTLAGSAVAVTSDRLGVEAVRDSPKQTVQVWMAVRQQAAQRFADAVSTPGSPSYQRFLSPTAYTQRFGPSAAQVRTVKSYLARAGFAHVRASVNDDFISATAPLPTIDRVFSVRLRRYLIGPKGTHLTIESSDRDPTVPVSIRRDVLSITGVNTTQARITDTTAGAGRSTSTPTAPASNGTGATAAGCSQYWGQKTRRISPAFRGLTQVAVAVCGYSAAQIRDAYGLSSANTGAGKTIALVEVGEPDEMIRTLTDYAHANGLPAPRSHQLREITVGRGNACGNDYGGEEQIDSEAAYAMAPSAKQLMVDGDSCVEETEGPQADLDAELAPLTGHGSSPSADIESWSGGIGTESVSPALRRASHAIALRAAAEGVSLLVASDDYPGVALPASDPDVTAVGGTTLGIGAQGQRLFETGWSDGLVERTGNGGPWQYRDIYLASGGGASHLYREPGYQKAIVPSSMANNHAGHPGRTVPDISADADLMTGMLFGQIRPTSNGKTTPYTTFVGDGTSLSTPLVAGIVVDAEQGQPRNFGFLNPLLYSLSGSPAFHDILPLSSSDPQVDRAAYADPTALYHRRHKPVVSLFNDQDPRHTHQVTAPGYDTMTGLGTPSGTAFIDGLRSATSPRRRAGG